MIKNNLSKKIIFIISLLFLFSIALTNVSATEINISNSDNLGQTIANANDGDIINLNTGTYTNNVSNIQIKKNITLKGNGNTKDVIIDAEKNSGIFTMETGINVTFINITFINGKNTGSGGAIGNSYASTMMTFINCSFINNSADNYGGAINNVGNNLTVENCIFINNNVTRDDYSGGAIRNQGNNLTVINSTFINNEADEGGAIFDMGYNFTVTNSTFTNNTARGYGGAICLYYRSDFTMENCDFNNNTATWGGAFFNWLRENITIINSTFTNNNATKLGGGGGAIYNEGDNFSIINSTFTSNLVRGYGGAIINHGAKFTIKNSIFTKNSAYYSGGAIYNHDKTPYSSGTSNFEVINSTFMGNTAEFGGAIYNLGNSSKILNSNFIANTAEVKGGAVFNNAKLNVSNSNFTNNKAGTGGGIYNNRNMSVSKNIMTGNSANLGNMIYNAGEIGILKLTFLNNSTIKVGKNKNISLFATLTDDMGNTITGQDIEFLVNEIAIGSATSIEGFANISYTTPDFKGLIPVSGNYLGHIDDPITLLNGQLSIKTPTNTTILVPDSVTVGETVNISGVLRDEDGNTIGNVELNLNVNGENFIVNTDKNGKWILSYITTQIGVIEVIAIFTGNDDYFECENRTSFNVENIPSNESNTTNDTKNDTEDTNNNPNNPINPPYPHGPIDPPNPNIPGDTDDENLDNVKNNDTVAENISMKKTGMPNIAILLMILSIIVVSVPRKQK